MFESQPLSLTIPGSQIEVCRNQQCFDATFPTASCPPILGEPPCGTATFPERGPPIGAWFTQDQRLHVTYVVPPTQVQDGDVYDIHLAAADGTPVLDAHAIATYAVFHPNGERCPPACPLANLSPSD